MLLLLLLLVLLLMMMMLTQVNANSVAARCGLRAGDIVVRLCGQPADGMTHLMAQQTIASCTDTLEIIVERFGRRLNIRLAIIGFLYIVPKFYFQFSTRYLRRRASVA